MTVIRCTQALSAASGAVALATAIFLAASRSGVWINVSPSLPLGIYRVDPRPPVRGSVVLLCLPLAVGRMARERGYVGPGPCPGGAGRLGKIVAAVAGDTVDVEATGVTINGCPIASSAPVAHDRAGRPLAHVAPGPWVVPAGTIFLLATRHPLSFDSRYYGVVPTGAVYSVLSAVLRSVSLVSTGIASGSSSCSSR
ncbi:MAG TPA: conjugative transfer signal peptidase TraF [Gemmatimonadaceae bacterium]|jgi:conjugative transfer signal peptidase TraF|nr:conjugative transfer signal peptidase TraF [Gemmatimonadaceae bacterium]